MSLQDDVKTLLTANATLAAAFTGGIKVYDELGVSGLSRALTPNATNATTGKINPLLVIRERSLQPTTAIRDTVTQVQSYQQGVEILMYADKTAGYSVPETGSALVYSLLHGKRTSGVHLLFASENRMERDRNIDNACMIMVVYNAYGVRKP